MYSTIVIGSGFAGSVIARELAERNHEKVCVVEQRNHIGGNSYDEYDEYGILIHKYGPHIFHTNSQRVYEYLSRFTDWYDYKHEVAGNVYRKIIPIPFNLNTLMTVYGEEEGNRLKEKLLDQFEIGARIPILQLLKHADPDIKKIADYVYENIFLKYTMKQWGQTPEQVDKSVTARVPVLISYDNRYFQDQFQGMPLAGYTKLFDAMLDHPNITIHRNENAKEVLTFGYNAENTPQIFVYGKPFHGRIIYTGPLDELFDCCYGRLPYRSLRFEFEHLDVDYFQSHGVVNYTVSEDYTRITEFKRLTGQECSGTTIMKEYPMTYEGRMGQIPYYSIANEKNQALYEMYLRRLEQYNNCYALGRLAEYKYYNIDAITLKALELADALIEEEKE